MFQVPQSAQALKPYSAVTELSETSTDTPPTRVTVTRYPRKTFQPTPIASA